MTFQLALPIYLDTMKRLYLIFLNIQDMPNMINNSYYITLTLLSLHALDDLYLRFLFLKEIRTRNFERELIDEFRNNIWAKQIIRLIIIQLYMSPLATSISVALCRDTCQYTIPLLNKISNYSRLSQSDKDINYLFCGGGTYDEKEVKIGYWIELFKNSHDGCQRIQKGLYEKGTRIGYWKIILNSKEIQSEYWGEFNIQGMKTGLWIEPSERNANHEIKLKFTGKYNKGLRTSKNQQSGGGIYDDHGKKKINGLIFMNLKTLFLGVATMIQMVSNLVNGMTLMKDFKKKNMNLVLYWVKKHQLIAQGCITKIEINFLKNEICYTMITAFALENGR